MNITIPTIDIFGIAIGLFFVVLLIAMWRASKTRNLDWMDMITRDGTKVSTTKVLQLVGGAVGTWIIVKTTLQEHLTWDLFAIYLSYVASIDGFSKIILAKYGAAGSDDSNIPYKRNLNGVTVHSDVSSGSAKPPNDEDDK